MGVRPAKRDGTITNLQTASTLVRNVKMVLQTVGPIDNPAQQVCYKLIIKQLNSFTRSPIMVTLLYI